MPRLADLQQQQTPKSPMRVESSMVTASQQSHEQLVVDERSRHSVSSWVEQKLARLEFSNGAVRRPRRAK